MRDYVAKIISRDEAKRIRENYRNEGKTVVFTNGCYDILHAGHVSGIYFARNQGDVLFLGINSDLSVRLNKGPNRPIIPQQQRAELLAALESVDYVVLFDEKEVAPLIGEILPDVLVKGADRADHVVGREVVEAHGGVIRLAPFIEGWSTTDIIAKVVEISGGG